MIRRRTAGTCRKTMKKEAFTRLLFRSREIPPSEEKRIRVPVRRPKMPAVSPFHIRAAVFRLPNAGSLRNPKKGTVRPHSLQSEQIYRQKPCENRKEFVFLDNRIPIGRTRPPDRSRNAPERTGSTMKRLPIPPAATDGELVALLRQDDLRSYEMLFHRYYNLFLGFAQGLVKERQTAEDIVQEVFMQLWIHRLRLDERRSLYNLLFTMTKHRIYDHFRRKYDLETFDRNPSRYDTFPDEGGGVESDLEAEQLRRTISQAVTAMPPQRRTIFVLSREEHLSRQEIARRLGVSVRTVDKHLELALREIRTRLKEYRWLLFLLLFP